LSQAKTYLKQAIAIFKQFSTLAELARVWNELGLVYFQQGRSQEAILHLENSLKTWQDLGNEVEEIEVLLDITECELIKGNQQAAELRLKKVEYLIGRDHKDGRHHRFQPRLTKYRRSLLIDSSTSYDRSRTTG
jgi:tetratricopeptide (TPR) repeat protein